MVGRVIPPKNTDETNLTQKLTLKKEVKSPDFCVSPLETESNDENRLTLYLALHRAAMGGTERQGAESTLLTNSLQPLENTALSGKKRQWEAPFGNLPSYQSGEDRI